MEGTAISTIVERDKKSQLNPLKDELRVASKKSSGVKRKRFDSRSSRSRKKKVLFENAYTKLRDEEGRDFDCYRKVYQRSSRRGKDMTGYIDHLDGKGGVSSDEPNVELCCNLGEFTAVWVFLL